LDSISCSFTSISFITNKVAYLYAFRNIPPLKKYNKHQYRSMVEKIAAKEIF
jgi:hypothetical protein